MQTPPRIIICGAPASGKGTQCEFIKEEFKVVHLSTGDMLREAVKANTALGAEAKNFMDRGELVPDSTMIGIILDRLKEQDCVTQGWLLDGFPRTGVQADALINAGVQCDILVQLDVTDSLLVERVVGRRSDPVTNKIYHLKYSPPSDPAVAARLVHRSDDTEEKVLVRLAAYHKNLASILDKYTDRTHRCVVKTNDNPPSVYWQGIRRQIHRSRQFQVIFILGGPGSGKGTLCQQIEKEFGYKHLSAGDLLREEIASGSDTAEMIKKITVSGGIVPAHVTVSLLLKAMQASGKAKFLIDGFPRNLENLSKWNDVMTGSAIVDFALFLECDEATMKERLLERGKTSGRADDNEGTIVQRFRTFYRDSMSVLDCLKRAGKVRSINARVPPRVVFQQAYRLFLGLSLSPPLTRTFALIKPDAVSLGHVPAILEAISSAGLTVVMNKLVYMNAEVATQFYHEHSLKNFFPNLRQFMTSGPSLALVLEGVDAVGEWRKLLGPTDSAKASIQEPNSIRGRFGTDGTRNACHGSDSFASALREIDFWSESGPGGKFEMSNVSNSITQLPATTATTATTTAPADAQPATDAATAKGSKGKGKDKKTTASTAAATAPAPAVAAAKPAEPEDSSQTPVVVRIQPAGLPTDNTFAIIKPGTADNCYEEVMAMATVHGFEVVSETRTRLTRSLAEAFYAEHKGRPFFDNLVAYMTSGYVVVLHLKREGAVAAWRTLIGPTDSFKASAFAPFSIRGKFGADNTKNAVHGSDSAASVAREIDFFFSYGPTANHIHAPVAPIQLSSRPLGSLDTGISSPLSLMPRHARKVQQLPTINRKDIPVMSKYAYEQVDPIMQVLMRRLLVERPSNLTDFCMAEFTEMSNNAIKLDPLSSASGSTTNSPVKLAGSASSPAVLSGGGGGGGGAKSGREEEDDAGSVGAIAGDGGDDDSSLA